MGRKFQYTSLDRILSKIYRDLGIEEISETDVIEWSGEALEGIGAITLYEEAVAFVEVENHEAKLPNGLHSIMQIARNNHWVKENPICPANILYDCSTEEMAEETPECTTCDTPVVDCNGKLVGDFEVAYYRPYFDLQYEYHGWMKSNMYQKHYSLVRLSNHTFFSSLVCNEDEGLYQSCSDEYTIATDKLRFSFREGSVAIAYTRQVVDQETGYPMIPDDYSVITAITMYITMKYMGRMWYMGREGYSDKYQKAEADWQWYCRQAANSLTKLFGEDEHQNFLEGRFQLIPNHKKYFGHFGKLGREQYTGFKDPNKRNFRLRGI
jgi:hypothetical protein